jgi:cilia- and flagella-associated protein 57
LQEDALAVAFHPSGFHVIVTIQEKIIILNVLAKSLVVSRSIQIKGCREVQFSNGGHLFAAAYGNNATYVFNFYTGENPPNFQFRGHTQKVRSVDWFDDDMGFVSTSTGGDVYFWDLINVQEGGSYRIADKDFVKKSVSMTSVCNIPNRHQEVFCAGSEKAIFNSNTQNKEFPCNDIVS